MTERVFHYIDTHTHLDDEQFKDDIDVVLSEAANAGVTRMINIGYDPLRWESTRLLAAREPRVSFTLGLHPSSADQWSDSVSESLAYLVTSTGPVAVGEIGLDYHWTSDNKALQRTCFQAQIELAFRSDLPIVVHQRSAASDVASILRNAPPDLRVLLHSFDGDPELGTLARDRGWTIGVGGLMTRRQNERLRDCLSSLSLNKIVLETDSPYLVPSGVKARRNTPAAIPLIAERLSSATGWEVADIARRTTANAMEFFEIGTPEMPS